MAFGGRLGQQLLAALGIAANPGVERGDHRLDARVDPRVVRRFQPPHCVRRCAACGPDLSALRSSVSRAHVARKGLHNDASVVQWAAPDAEVHAFVTTSSARSARTCSPRVYAVMAVVGHDAARREAVRDARLRAVWRSPTRSLLEPLAGVTAPATRRRAGALARRGASHEGATRRATSIVGGAGSPPTRRAGRVDEIPCSCHRCSSRAAPSRCPTTRSPRARHNTSWPNGLSPAPSLSRSPVLAHVIQPARGACRARARVGRSEHLRTRARSAGSRPEDEEVAGRELTCVERRGGRSTRRRAGTRNAIAEADRDTSRGRRLRPGGRPRGTGPYRFDDRGVGWRTRPPSPY